MLPKQTLWLSGLQLHTPRYPKDAPVSSSFPILDALSSPSFYEKFLGQTLAHEISSKGDAKDFLKRELRFEENDSGSRHLRKACLDVAICAYLLCLEANLFDSHRPELRSARFIICYDMLTELYSLGTPPSTLLSVVVLASIFMKRLESVASLPSMQDDHHSQQEQQLSYHNHSKKQNHFLGVLEPLLFMATNSPRQRTHSVDHYSTVAYDDEWRWRTTPCPLEGIVLWAPLVEGEPGLKSSNYGNGEGGGSQFTFRSTYDGSSDCAAGTPSSVNSIETTASAGYRQQPQYRIKTGSLQELDPLSLVPPPSEKFSKASSLFSQMEPHRTLRSTKLMLDVHHAKNTLDLILRLVPFLYLAYIYLEDRPRHSVVGRELDLEDDGSTWTQDEVNEPTHFSRPSSVVQDRSMTKNTACTHDQKQQNKQKATTVPFVTVTHDVAHRKILSVMYRTRYQNEDMFDKDRRQRRLLASSLPRGFLVSLESIAAEFQNRSPPVLLFPPNGFTEIGNAVHDARRKFYRFDDVVRCSNRNITMVLRVLGFRLHATPEEWMAQLDKMLQPCPASIRQQCEELLDEMHL